MTIPKPKTPTDIIFIGFVVDDKRIILQRTDSPTIYVTTQNSLMLDLKSAERYYQQLAKSTV